jgi:hypothetical protein
MQIMKVSRNWGNDAHIEHKIITKIDSINYKQKR